MERKHGMGLREKKGCTMCTQMYTPNMLCWLAEISVLFGVKQNCEKDIVKSFRRSKQDVNSNPKFERRYIAGRNIYWSMFCYGDILPYDFKRKKFSTQELPVSCFQLVENGGRLRFLKLCLKFHLSNYTYSLNSHIKTFSSWFENSLSSFILCCCFI